jgi:hypothetical protein
VQTTSRSRILGRSRNSKIPMALELRQGPCSCWFPASVSLVLRHSALIRISVWLSVSDSGRIKALLVRKEIWAQFQPWLHLVVCKGTDVIHVLKCRSCYDWIVAGWIPGVLSSFVVDLSRDLPSTIPGLQYRSELASEGWQLVHSWSVLSVLKREVSGWFWDIGQVPVRNLDWLPFTPLWSPSPVLQSSYRYINSLLQIHDSMSSWFGLLSSFFLVQCFACFNLLN